MTSKDKCADGMAIKTTACGDDTLTSPITEIFEFAPPGGSAWGQKGQVKDLNIYSFLSCASVSLME